MPASAKTLVVSGLHCTYICFLREGFEQIRQEGVCTVPDNVILWLCKPFLDVFFVIQIQLRILQDISVMTSTAESREDVSKQQSFVTYSLQLNSIHLLSCVIVLRTSYRLVNLDMGTVYTTYDPFKTISIFKEVCSPLLCFAVRPLDILCH